MLKSDITPVPLAQAAIEVQLAVDLIMLLEQQQLPPAIILAALEIVQKDFRRAEALSLEPSFITASKLTSEMLAD